MATQLDEFRTFLVVNSHLWLGNAADALEYMGDIFTYASSVYEREVDTNLRVLKECKQDHPLEVGQSGQCTILIDNLGPSTAQDVELSDTLVSDGNINVVSVTSIQGPCIVGGSQLTINCGTGEI